MIVHMSWHHHNWILFPVLRTCVTDILYLTSSWEWPALCQVCVSISGPQWRINLHLSWCELDKQWEQYKVTHCSCIVGQILKSSEIVRLFLKKVDSTTNVFKVWNMFQVQRTENHDLLIPSNHHFNISSWQAFLWPTEYIGYLQFSAHSATLKFPRT